MKKQKLNLFQEANRVSILLFTPSRAVGAAMKENQIW
jgi:hypothetical protein